MRPISSTCFLRNCDKLEPCVVVYVSEPKYYYTVEFIDYGIKESFKVPYVNEIEAFKKDPDTKDHPKHVTNFLEAMK